MGDPALTGMGWTIPAARGPDVLAAFVAVVAVNPHVTTIGRGTTAFNDGRRRPDANRNLRKRSRRGESESEQQCQCNLFHDESIPPWIVFETSEAFRIDNSINATLRKKLCIFAQ